MHSILRNWQHCFTAVLLLALFAGGAAEAQSIRFVNATSTWKVWGNNDTNGAACVSCFGHGVAMADATGDGRPDIYITNAVRYANEIEDGDGLEDSFYANVSGRYFEESDSKRKISDQHGWTGSHGVLFYDFDNDGDYDLANATTDDRTRLYRNNSTGFFEDATDAARLPLIRNRMPDFDPDESYGNGTRALVAFDANNDGWMDLYATNWGPAEKRWAAPGAIEGAPIITPVQPNEFYLNQGDGTYKRVTSSGATPDNPAWLGTQGCTVIDADEDGNMDIFVARRNYVAIDPVSKAIVGGPTSREVYNLLFLGDGAGHFVENAGGAGLNTNSGNDCNGATFADYDNDGDYDAFIVPKDKKDGKVRAYRNNGRGKFTEVTGSLNISQHGFSLVFLDADNDGDLDIIAPLTRDFTRFYRNDGGGSFSRDDNTGLRFKSFDPRGCAVGDVDDDGDLDLYYADANKDGITVSASYPDTIGNHLFINTTSTSNRWLRITGRGPRGDMGGFGTKIWVYDRGHMDDPAHLVGYRQVINGYGYLCQDEPVQHFGLGSRDSVDVRVRLLDRTELRLYRVPARRKLFFSKPAEVALVSGDGQSVKPGEALPQPLVVKVTDAYGNPVYGAAVTFGGAGSFIESQPLHTDARGHATVHYLPAAEPARQTVTARCADASGAGFDFTVMVTPLVIARVPASLAIAGGNSQHAIAGTQLAEPLQVRVYDQFNTPLGGVPVHFTDVNGWGHFPDGTTAVSDETGLVSVRYRFGEVTGIYEVAAAAEGVSGQALFSLQAEALPNRPPEFLSWAPADSELFVNGYHILDFSVNATDADGDSVRYLWLIDGEKIAGRESTFRVYPLVSSTGRVEVRISDGEVTISRSWVMHLLTGVETESRAPVQDYALLQNYPNPFNPQTQIEFHLPAAGRVELRILNTAGQTVRTLADAVFAAGRHTLVWDACDQKGQPLPTGLYYYTMESGDFRVVRKLLYVK
ncbi:MAG TPA: FG-GAP-like repeat-containing protein [bacterium]|nr:FG-GAP-like repeat-containing protein [bacterium]